MNYTDEFPNLAMIFSYFNQDWVLLFLWEDNEPNIDAVVRYFKTNHFLETVEMALKEAKQIIKLSEEDLEEAIDEFSFGVFMPNETASKFFKRIYKILNESNTVTENQFIPISHKLYSPKKGN